MVYCSVSGCKNNNDRRSKNKFVGQFHKFPETDLKKEWIVACNREIASVKSARVCSIHFNENSYTLRSRLLGNFSYKKELNKCAVPTLFLPVSKTIIEESEIFSEIKRKNFVAEILKESYVCENLSENNLETSSKSQRFTDTGSQTEGSPECELQLEIFKLKKQLEEAKNENTQLKSELRKYKTEREKLEDSLKTIFTPGQIKKLWNQSKRIKWSLDDISFAISLHTAGSHAYRYLYKKGFPLPGLSTLRKWALKIKVQPGVLTSVLKLMQNADLQKTERLCVLSFDEIKIKSEFEYDRANDSIIKPSNYVQVGMVRGLVKKWKQPVFYDYDCNMTVPILMKIISMLYDAGYFVAAIVSDMGPGNQGLWKALSIDLEHTSFPHPRIPESKVLVFADAPHLLKLVRNHYLDTGFVLDGKWISVNPVKEILDAQSTSDLKISHKITFAHINVKDATRQNVRLAAQLLSHSVSCCLKRFMQSGRLSSENAIECAEFIKLINDWFDILNSKVPEIDKRDRTKAYGLALDEQERILTAVDEMISNLRIPKKSHLLPFQKGILINNKSLRGLLSYLKSKYDLKYILTNRLNQDVLENFFSAIRSKGGLNDHPTALQFKYRLRSYLLGRTETIIHCSNIEKDNDVCLNLNYADKEEPVMSHKFLQSISKCEVYIDPDINDRQEFDELHLDALENLAGYIIRKCGYMCENDYVDKSKHSFTWVDELSEGGLIKPSARFLEEMRKLEVIFVSVNQQTITVRPEYIRTLLSIAKNVDLNDKAKELFYRCRTYFRIKYLNLHSRDVKYKGKYKKMRKICT